MLSPTEFVVTIADGVKVVTSASVRSITTFVLLEQEDWFEAEMGFVRSFVRPGMRVLDIGANHGVYALAMAARLRGQGKVWAFEPTAEPAARLARSIELNGLDGVVELLRCGLSDSAREAQIFVSEQSELNSLHGGSGPSERVRLDTLDAVRSRCFPEAAVDFVKLDAEGEEVAVVAGGSRFFAEQSPLVMFEIKHGNEYNHGLGNRFLEAGYALFRLVPGLGVLVPMDAAGEFETFQLNLFAAKPDRVARLCESGQAAVSAKTHPAPVPTREWRDALAAFPYTAAYIDRWRAPANAGEERLASAHGSALNSYVSAQDVGLPAADRLALLERARQSWEALHEAAPEQGAISVCLARARFDLGLRAAALQALHRASGASSAEWSDERLPFLPPLSSYDHKRVAGSASTWMLAALTEAAVRWGSFSSIFSIEHALWLHHKIGNPDLGLAMQKRLVLAALYAGVPVGIPPASPLLTSSSENRNAAIWRRWATGSAQAA